LTEELYSASDCPCVEDRLLKKSITAPTKTYAKNVEFVVEENLHLCPGPLLARVCWFWLPFLVSTAEWKPMPPNTPPLRRPHQFFRYVPLRMFAHRWPVQLINLCLSNQTSLGRCLAVIALLRPAPRRLRYHLSFGSKASESPTACCRFQTSSLLPP
jgi:hypothetical protein